MKKTRSAFLGILGLSVALILAAGCYRPAAPDVTVAPEGVTDTSPVGTPDLEATAIANATEAARAAEEQTPGPEDEEPPADETEPPATPEPESPTETPEVATETPAPTEAVPTPQPTAPPEEETTYVVQSGDTLFTIAVQFGTTVDVIADANDITDPETIYVGQELIIPEAGAPAPSPSPSPGETTYVVQPGDNLFRIALRFNLTYQRLAEYNGITDPNDIYVGQVLRIPQQ
ncbi:MAG: LysM peptidoglycan-binding domain-containing protein [Chloroflexota bacterium]